MMNLLEYSAQGATVQLGQRELLLLMALLQDETGASRCKTDDAGALDEFFSAVNIKVEESRRKQAKKAMMREKISAVPAPAPKVHRDVSNA